MTVGERIRNRRIELNMTQAELAKRMGYTSKAAICKAEKSGDNMTTDRISLFAKALFTTESYLMGWNDYDEAIETKASASLLADDDPILKRIIKAYYEMEESKRSLLADVAESMAHK